MPVNGPGPQVSGPTSPSASQLLSPSNVAVYGGLCALATFDRQELQRNVISSSSFKLFLELEPQVRDIIFKFYESKYASCLKMLDEMKDNLLLDMYLAPHVRTLYTQIRNRALIQVSIGVGARGLGWLGLCGMQTF